MLEGHEENDHNWANFKKILSMKRRRIPGDQPPCEDFAFFDLWSKPAALYLLERMRMNGSEVFRRAYADASVRKKILRALKKIGCEEIEKPTVYRGIKRKYCHSDSLKEAL